MTPMQFITCSDEGCPFNKDKSCRAPFVMIDDNGRCLIRDHGPFTFKSETEQYVEIRECRCQKCNHWELDESINMGTCGLRENLHFIQHKDEPVGPKCSNFEKQIEQPGFNAPNV